MNSSCPCSNFPNISVYTLIYQAICFLYFQIRAPLVNKSQNNITGNNIVSEHLIFQYDFLFNIRSIAVTLVIYCNISQKKINKNN